MNPFVRAKRDKEGKTNGPFNYPNSEGCQILKDADFNTLIEALDDMGFKSGEKIKVDVCEVVIKQGRIKNE